MRLIFVCLHETGDSLTSDANIANTAIGNKSTDGTLYGILSSYALHSTIPSIASERNLRFSSTTLSSLRLLAVYINFLSLRPPVLYDARGLERVHQRLFPPPTRSFTDIYGTFTKRLSRIPPNAERRYERST